MKLSSLRHTGRGTDYAEKKVGGEWFLANGECLFDLSGGPFIQTLVNLNFPPPHLFQNVSGPGGVDTSVRLKLEAEILKRTGSNCSGILWATSGSDAIESALWAVQSSLCQWADNDQITYIVREGSYHGNTDLTRWLSMRGHTPKDNVRGRIKRVVIGSDNESYDAFSAFTDHIEREKPIVVLLETVPTTGHIFWQGREFYNKLLRCCHEKQIPVVVDEVACGAYRHGWFSAFEWLPDYPPAAVVIAKGLTCGTYPLSCVLLRNDVVSSLQTRTRLPAYTFGLTDPGAWLALEALSIFDGLLRNGGFDARKMLINTAVRFLTENHFNGLVESTGTTLRLAISDSSKAKKFILELRKQGLITYTNTTVLKDKPVTFIFCCPPLDLDQDFCASLFDQFCSIAITAR